MSKALGIWQEFQAGVPENWVGYLESPLPSHRDGIITRLIEDYRRMNNVERQELRRLLRGSATVPFLAYAERMATLGLRERAAAHLENGLAAITMEDFQSDPKDAIPLLALHYHTARRVRADPAALFQAAAEHASPQVAEVLRRFPERSELDKSLSAMGYRETQDPKATLAYEMVQ